MPLDTADKRRAILGVFPIADCSLEAAHRSHFLHRLRGREAAAQVDDWRRAVIGLPAGPDGELDGADRAHFFLNLFRRPFAGSPMTTRDNWRSSVLGLYPVPDGDLDAEDRTHFPLHLFRQVQAPPPGGPRDNWRSSVIHLFPAPDGMIDPADRPHFIFPHWRDVWMGPPDLGERGPRSAGQGQRANPGAVSARSARAGPNRLVAPIARLAGFPIDATSPVRWSMTSGVEPYIGTFDIDPRLVPRLDAAARAGPVTLEMIVDGEPVRFRELWIIGFEPGDHAQTFRVKVADRRWLWLYGVSDRKFNLRRVVGTKRVGADDVPENQTLIDRRDYLEWSLKDPNTRERWSAREILDQVLRDALSIEDRKVGELPIPIAETDDRIHCERRILETLDELPVENMLISDRADLAVLRALAAMPAADIFIDPGGRVRVYSRASGFDAAVVNRARPEIEGKGHADWIPQHLVRPSKYIVLFEYRAELLFRVAPVLPLSAPGGGALQQIPDEDIKATERLLTNVMPLPDWSLQIANPPAVGGAREVTEGTYVPIDDNLYAAWGPAPFVQQVLADVHVRRGMLPAMDLWAFLALSGESDPDADWMARISALVTHWRRTFQIPKQWRDAMVALQPHRLGITDIGTGSRKAAELCTDYVAFPGQRAFFGTAVPAAFHAMNVSGFPPGGILQDGARPVPARVSIEHEDLGIISIQIQNTIANAFEGFIPGRVVGGTNPTADARLANRQGVPIAFDSISSPGNVPELADDWQALMIVSAIPARPNDLRRFHKIEINVEDVVGQLPPNIARGAARVDGPTKTIIIPPELVTANVRWSSNGNDPSEIAKLFGFGLPPEDPRAPEEGLANVDHLIINKQPADLERVEVSGPSLEATARAAVLEDLSGKLDRYLGSMAGLWQAPEERPGGIHVPPGLRPAGNIDEISWVIDPNGQAYVELSMPEEVETLPMVSFLDPATRAILFRVAQR